MTASRTGTPRSLAGGDVVPGEQRDPARHRVLREVGVRPLVDPVVDPVAPGLEELGRRPGVVDLVEVHPRGLREPERAETQAGDDEHDQDPDVEAVQAAALLPHQQPRAVGTDRRLADPRPEPGDRPDLVPRPALEPRRDPPAGRRGCGAGECGGGYAGRRPGHRCRVRRDRVRCGRGGRTRRDERLARVPPPSPAAARRPARPRAVRRAPPRSCSSANTSAAVCSTAMTATPQYERTAGPIPSQSSVCGLFVYSVVRTTYMLRNVATEATT